MKLYNVSNLTKPRDRQEDTWRRAKKPDISQNGPMRVVLSFLGVLSTRYPLGRCADFDDQYVKRRRFA